MRDWLVSIAAAAIVLLTSSLGFAQELERFELNRFQPAPAGDRFFGVQGGDPASSGPLRVMALGNYAYRPLVLYRDDGDERVGSVVSDQLLLHGAVALGLFERLLLSVDVPIALVTDGDSPEADGLDIASPSGSSLGDVRLGARVRVLGEAREPLELALGGYVWLPTGDEEKFAGDGKVRGLPALIAAGEVGRFAYAANAGVMLRPERQFAATQIGTELVFGAAAGVLFAKRKLLIGPELYGSTTFDDAFQRDTTNLEAILGAKLRVGPVVLGAGAGPGLTRGLGTPSLRALLSVTIAPQAAEDEAVSDRDHDGIIDEFDACPTVPGKVSVDPQKNGCPPDRDGDGILDSDDACPKLAGAPNEDRSKHGCPPDRDGDGILDSDDACPDVPGPRSDDPKLNGCPLDRDGDGITDDKDACPDVKGVASEDPAKHGCPGDTDGDGITDDKDACPKEKGGADADPAKNGCPSMVRVTEKEIVILQQVQFKTASDAILPASDELLGQVANVLRDHAEITKIEVQGHTDNRGGAAYNRNLSQRRAASVVKWLIDKGKIEPERLVAKGYGMTEPIAGNDTDEGRQQNRRVQFKILESSSAPATPAGAPGDAP
ncbi:MAG TPA: OmpA family protein [Polyangiaceae bacterium]|nr:OmpA family protein [Polyangiaceae bacterium]